MKMAHSQFGFWNTTIDSAKESFRLYFEPFHRCRVWLLEKKITHDLGIAMERLKARALEMEGQDRNLDSWFEFFVAIRDGWILEAPSQSGAEWYWHANLERELDELWKGISASQSNRLEALVSAMNQLVFRKKILEQLQQEYELTPFQSQFDRLLGRLKKSPAPAASSHVEELRSLLRHLDGTWIERSKSRGEIEFELAKLLRQRELAKNLVNTRRDMGIIKDMGVVFLRMFRWLGRH